MLGKRPAQRELFSVDSLLREHVGDESFYAYLSREGAELFKDSDFADLYGKRGRPSVPPSQMCILLVLQAREAVSDQESIDRTAYDIRWKVALGVELEDKLCAKSTLQLFRANLLLNERYLRLFEASVAACRAQGLGASKKLEVAIDSTPVLGRGAVKDTYNLVSDAIRRVIEDACKLKQWDRGELVAEQGLGRHFGSSFKGESELDWSDEDERHALLAQLVADARIGLQVARKALRGHAKDSPKTRQLQESQALLGRVLAQDIDEKPDDGDGPRIRKGTAKDRVLSTSDPEMRHGHKSHSKGFDGYKASLVVETKDCVILATDIRAANVPDRNEAVALLEAASEAAGSKVEHVLGDTAYGDMGTRREIEKLGADLTAKAPPLQSRQGTFKRDMFQVSDRRAEATCPAGKHSRRRSRTPEDDGYTYFFSRNDCTPCPLRELCTKSAKGARTITVTEGSKELDRLRKHQKTKTFKTRYRRRVVVEHAFGRLRRVGIRQARYFGSKKVAMQVAMAAMVANLSLAAVSPLSKRVLRALLSSWAAIVNRPPFPTRPIASVTPPLEMGLCRPDL